MLDCDITLQRGGFALQATFTAKREATALFGPSGAGKSTLLAAIAGLVTPDSGHIRLDDRTLFDSDGKNMPVHQRRIGFVFQDDRLFPHMTVAQNLAFGSPDRTLPNNIADLLDLVPLLDRRPRSLSGGERQRVALGRALAVQPDVLLLDEPLAALDIHRKGDILPYLKNVIRQQNMHVLYVSHDLDEVARLCSQIIVLDQGRVIAQGALAATLNRPDMQHLSGDFEAGAILTARITEHLPADHLTVLSCGSGQILVGQLSDAVGTDIQLRIRARDVAIAITRPTHISIRNILPATVTQMVPFTDSEVEIALDMGGQTLWSRVTRHAARDLDLENGQQVFALIKSVAVA